MLQVAASQVPAHLQPCSQHVRTIMLSCLSCASLPAVIWSTVHMGQV
jgi:hypothetical protein